MARLKFVLAAVTAWACFAPGSSFAQVAGPVFGVSEAVTVSDTRTAIIGTATQTLIDAGAAYYEIVDDLGVLDSGYIPISEDGSYRAFLTAELQVQIVGDPQLLLYDWDSPPASAPTQINFMMSPDTITQTFTRLMATGDAAEIRTFIQTLKDIPGLYGAEIAALEA